MNTYKLVLGSVSTPLDNLLQPVRHTLHTRQRTWILEGLPASLLLFGRDVLWHSQNIPQASLPHLRLVPGV